jgi:hypothetical protein
MDDSRTTREPTRALARRNYIVFCIVTTVAMTSFTVGALVFIDAI